MKPRAITFVNGTLKVTSTSKVGDCDGDGVVSVAEVQGSINAFLGLKAVSACLDPDNSGSVGTAEVQKAINGFLGL